MSELARRLASLASSPAMTEQRAFEYGADCARNGSNETNCNFRIFSRPEFTRAWERGKKQGATPTGGTSEREADRG